MSDASRIEELEAQVAQLTKRNTHQRDRIVQYREQRNQATAKVNELAGELRKAASEYGRETRDGLRRKIGKLEGELAEQVDAKSAEVRTLQTALSNQRTSIANLYEKLDRCQKSEAKQRGLAEANAAAAQALQDTNRALNRALGEAQRIDRTSDVIGREALSDLADAVQEELRERGLCS